MDRPTDLGSEAGRGAGLGGPPAVAAAAASRSVLRDAVPADGPAEPDRRRSIYLGACRVDVVRRAGTARLLSDRRLGLAVVRALEAAGAPTPASVTVVLTDDAELRDLNRSHLQRDEPTDVLSFPMQPPEAYPPRGEASPRGVTSPRGADAAPDEPAAGGRPSSVQRGAAPAIHPAARGERTHIGDIAISVERAIDQAESGRGGQTGDVTWSPADELRLLVTHGSLHLCGWDHAEADEESAMRALEQRLLAEDRR